MTAATGLGLPVPGVRPASNERCCKMKDEPYLGVLLRSKPYLLSAREPWRTVGGMIGV